MQRTQEEMRQELLGRAAADDAFRTRLIEDPKAAIKEALNVDLPDTVTVHVHEDSALSAHLVLPPTAALGDADLEAIAAGHDYEETGFGWYRTPTGPHTHYEGGPVHG